MDEKQNSLFIFDRNDATMIMRRKLIHKTLRGWVFYFGKKCILPFASFGSVKTCVAAVRSGAFFRAQLRLRTFCILEVRKHERNMEKNAGSGIDTDGVLLIADCLR